MAGWWKKLRALVLAGLCVTGSAAQAQQAGDIPLPPSVVVYPSMVNAPAAPNPLPPGSDATHLAQYRLAASAPKVYPAPDPTIPALPNQQQTIYQQQQQPNYYPQTQQPLPVMQGQQTAYPVQSPQPPLNQEPIYQINGQVPVSAQETPLIHSEGTIIHSCDDCAGHSSGRRWFHKLRPWSSGGCESWGIRGSSGRGPVQHTAATTHRVLLMDCWAHHDEVGCTSLWAELRFIFGSCRTFFGETCRPGPPPIPVPPGYVPPFGPGH